MFILKLIIYVLLVIHGNCLDEMEIIGLNALYESLNGMYWINKWNITCINNNNDSCICIQWGIICNDTNHVVILDLEDNPDNNVTGYISSDISNLIYLTNITIHHQYNISGEIPLSVYNMTNLTALWLAGAGFTGTISPNICNLHNLISLVLTKLTDLKGRIPDCFGNKESFPKMFDLEINSNIYLDLSDSLPFICNITTLVYLLMYRDCNFVNCNANPGMNSNIPSCIGNLDRLMWLNFAQNNMKGSIPDSITKLTALEIFSLPNNQLSGTLPNISKLTSLTQMDLSCNKLEGSLTFLSNITNLATLALHSNQFTGTLPDIKAPKLENITLQNNSIEGSLPSTFYAPNLMVLFAINNRLSCDVPSYGFPNILDVLILLKNHLRMLQGTPNWVSVSPFKSVESLYVSQKDWNLGIIILTFCVLVFMINIIISIMDSRNKKQYSIPFFRSVYSIQKHFRFYGIYITSLVLLVIYLGYSQYYECIEVFNKFSFAYYYANNTYIDWIVLLLGMFGINLYLYQYYKVRRNNLSILPNAGNKKIINESNDHICKSVLSLMVYLSLYVITLFVLFIYICSRNIPSNDNILHLNQYWMDLIEYSVSILLGLTTSIIVPNLTDSFYKILIKNNPISYEKFVLTYRANFIIILRAITSIVFPFIITLLFVNDCGNMWTYFWNTCAYNRNELSVTITNGGIPFVLLTPDQICGFKYNQILSEQCLRSFNLIWCNNILIKKMIFMVFLSFFVVIKRIIIKKCKDKCCKKRNDNIVYKIDSEYSMVISKLEIIIIFGLISPFLIPLGLLSIYIDVFVYNYMVNNYGWLIYPFTKRLYIPIYYINISIIMGNAYIILLSFYLLDNIHFWILSVNLVFVITGSIWMKSKKYVKSSNVNMSVNFESMD